MKTIQDIKKELDDIHPNDILKKIEYFRRNLDLILAIDETHDKGHYNAKTKLLSDFGILLSHNQNYEESYPILIKAIALFDNPIFGEETKNISSTYYHQLLFRFGITTYHTKRYSESKSTFIQLLESDPTNDGYKNWLLGIRLNPLNKILKVSGALFFVLVITKILLPTELSTRFSVVYYPTVFIFILFYLGMHIFKWYLKTTMKSMAVGNF